MIASFTRGNNKKFAWETLLYCFSPCCGAMTLCMMTLCLRTFSIWFNKNLRVIIYDTRSINYSHTQTSINAVTQKVVLNVIILNTAILYAKCQYAKSYHAERCVSVLCHAVRRYAEWCSSECHHAECRGATTCLNGRAVLSLIS